MDKMCEVGPVFN